ncbi:hypothetical protein DEU56DRAFT_761967 [Suillus clintonianus]|uniref:uncharacterized protein n=1 Tax=Suillus clintonianus TaxID=1904413 RepID=UPI001B886E07|nr:uncharacterized protein DEU56DRAFT_761967 [Suillus clintonianus]KAG2112872.1 hypothetical protein DEU56DRAFT_761967 [Suillus clintonianus]
MRETESNRIQQISSCLPHAGPQTYKRSGFKSAFPNISEHVKEKDYSRFWPTLIRDWFKQFPEEAVVFPDIAADALSPEQRIEVGEAENRCKIQLRTWFRWRANASKKNRSLKKESTVFDDVLQPKRRAKSEAELYSDIYYDERIKLLVKAEEEAGKVSSGRRIALGRKFSKELLNDEDEEVKIQIRDMSGKKNHLDEDSEDDCVPFDAEGIAQGIDDLPIICRRFAQLVKKKTGFLVSFMFAGPDPRNDWDMTSLFCHPSETQQGRTFAQLYQTADRNFLEVFQQYAEIIFPSDKRKPNVTVGNEDMECGEEVYGEEVPNGHDDVEEDNDIESFDQGEEEQEENEGSLLLPDASLGDASDAPGATPDASIGAMVDVPLQSDASSSYSNYDGVSAPIPHSYSPVYVPPTTNLVPNLFGPFYAPQMSTTSVPSSFTPAYTAPLMSTDGFTPVYNPSVSTPSFSFPNTWQDLNWTDPVFQTSPASAAAWLQQNLSPVSAERTSLHESSADSLPILPHPNPPSLDSLPFLPHPNPPQLPILPHPNPPQGTPNSLSAVITKPITKKTILEPKATQKPKAASKPKPKPKAIHKPKAATTPTITNPPGAESSSSGDVAPGGITNDESTNTRASKRVPVKSRRNELADAIGTGPSMKRPAQNGSAGAQQKKRAKV